MAYRADSARAAAPRAGCGSPAYMAPEQMRGMPLTVRADAWAFALLLWEMVTEQVCAQNAGPNDGLGFDTEVPLRSNWDWEGVALGVMQAE